MGPLNNPSTRGLTEAKTMESHNHASSCKPYQIGHMVHTLCVAHATWHDLQLGLD